MKCALEGGSSQGFTIDVLDCDDGDSLCSKFGSPVRSEFECFMMVLSTAVGANASG